MSFREKGLPPVFVWRRWCGASETSRYFQVIYIQEMVLRKCRGEFTIAIHFSFPSMVMSRLWWHWFCHEMPMQRADDGKRLSFLSLQHRSTETQTGPKLRLMLMCHDRKDCNFCVGEGIWDLLMLAKVQKTAFVFCPRQSALIWYTTD